MENPGKEEILTIKRIGSGVRETTKGIWILGIICLLLFFSTCTGWACEFYFNYPEIRAPLGVTGSIAVRVRKDHQNCTLEGMDYLLEWENIQVLQETPWVEVGNDLYEKRLQVVLSEMGSGYFLISKDCCREGYEEKRLPIQVEKGGESWEQAMGEEYPFPVEGEIFSLQGTVTVDQTSLLIQDKVILLPQIPQKLHTYPHPIFVYYQQSEAKKALLIVGEGIFYPFTWE